MSALLVLLQLLFFISTCFSSNLVRYNFQDNLNELRKCLNSGEDISSVINSFNIDSRGFYNEPDTEATMQIFRKFFKAKEEAIVLIMNNPNISLSTNEIRVFNDYLIQDFYRLEESFSSDNFGLVVYFLIKTFNRDVNELQPVLVKVMKFLTLEQTVQVLSLRQAKIDESRKLVNELIELIESMEFDESPDQQIIYSIISEEGFACESLKPKHLMIVLKLAIHLNFEDHPEWFDKIIDSIKNIVCKFKENCAILETVRNFALSDGFVKALPENELLDSYSMIIGQISRKVDMIGKVNELPEYSKAKVKSYGTKIDQIAKVYKLLTFIMKLDVQSKELDFNLALRSLENLKIFTRENGMARDIVVLEYDIFRAVLKGLSGYFHLEGHALHLHAWRVSFLVGTLFYNIVHETKKLVACTDIITGLAYILARNGKDLPEYLTSYIEEILPNIDIMIDATLTHIRVYGVPISQYQLNALIKAFKLHIIPSAASGFIDRLLYQYISDMPPQLNKFSSISSYEIVDERGVYLSGFLSYLQNYALNPSSSKLP